MCGIVGGLALSGDAIEDSVIRAMLSRVSRRGPDDQAIFRDDPCVLGHARLAIIDLSLQGRQPMRDASGRFSIVFNGTIYNYPELRNELILAGRAFQSSSDTEVIINAYFEWGENCVQRLQGEFAFVIWDSHSKQLFAARDRLGVKPLYYTKTAGGIYFASNVQALVHLPKCDTGIDSHALHHVLTLHGVVPAPSTVFKGVKKCPPGHLMSIDASGQVTTSRYWNLVARRPALRLSDSEWRERVLQALVESVVKRSRISDVPVGVLLSGGLDSSLLVALLAESGHNAVSTFSIGFEDAPEERGDEFEYSDLIAREYATEHHRYRISNSDILAHLTDAVASMSEPMFGQDVVAFYLLSRQVSQSVKVVQSGQGADEAFAGYAWYARMLASPGAPLQRFSQHYFDRDHDEYLRCVTSGFACDDVTSNLVSTELKTEHADTFMDAVLRFDCMTLVVDDPVRRIDNMSMAWGVDARVPFLDQHLVELAAQCPPELKLLNQGKGILKSIARGIVPDAIIDRPKGYFPVPALKYLRGQFLEFVTDILNSRACLERGILARTYVDELLMQPDAHMTRLNVSKPWQCAALELWLQKILS